VCNVNTGSEDLFVYNITPKNKQLGATEPYSGYPLSLGPDFCFPFQVAYTPTVFTDGFASSLDVSNSDPAQGSLRVDVTGSSIPGKIALSGSGEFGNVCAGSNAQKPFTIGNTGQCALQITGVAVDDGNGGACSDYVVSASNPFPATVAPGSGLPVTVAFTPTSGGSKTCRLVVASDDPATPAMTTPLSAATPPVNLLVSDVAGFPPTVNQSVGACSSQKPVTVANNGLCPVAITNVTLGGTSAADYSTAGLPSLTAPLQAGHVLGEGDLNVVFKPTLLPLSRGELASISVTYENDPITHATTSVSKDLCGEGVTRGARVLVVNAATGAPLTVVEKIQISRIGSNRKGISIDNAVSVALQPAVTQSPPCSSFRYHREWGGASNPVQLTAGDYQVTVTATSPSTRKKVTKTVSFTLGTCGFNPNIVIGI
jgi:hypothetical protein